MTVAQRYHTQKSNQSHTNLYVKLYNKGHEIPLEIDHSFLALIVPVIDKKECMNDKFVSLKHPLIRMSSTLTPNTIHPSIVVTHI